MAVYATVSDLTARLSAAYDVPDTAVAEKLLVRASEIIDWATLNRAQIFYEDDPDDDLGWRTTLKNATCDQVEFWLEVGEEHDVASMRGSIVSGRLQIHPTPPRLGDRAKQTLINGGLLYRGVGVK